MFLIKSINKLSQKNKIKKIILEKEKNNLPIKLHLGCGTNYFKGWINIDNNSDHNIKKLDINWDLRNTLPLKNNSVDFVYNEHFLEHLTVLEGQRAIAEFMRVLKKNGILRMAMPDLETPMKRYFDPNWKKAAIFKKFDLDFIKTKAEMINVSFRFWGHQWLYDSEELKRRLKEIGYKNIKFCKLRKSKYKELKNLETREESTLIVEVKK